MSTWKRVVAALEQRFEHVVHDGPSSLRLVLVVAGVHRVGVRLRSLDAYGEPVIVMTAEIGVNDAMDPWLGLATNQRLVTGAIAVDGPALVLRTVIDRVESLDARLELFAREAATMKQKLAPKRDAKRSSVVFHHFAE